MAIKEFWGANLFSRSTLQGRRDLAHRSWESNNAVI